MSFLGDVGDFEYFNLGRMADQIKENPARMLYGSADPFSTSVWNGVLGTDDKPLVDQWGGAAKQRYQEAEDAGINTGPGATMHGVARTIASFYAGGAAGKGLSGASSAGGASGMGGGTGVTSGGSGIGFSGTTSGSTAGTGGGTGITGYAGSGASSASPFVTTASGAGPSASSGGLLASAQQGYQQAKPYMDAVSTGMKVSKQLQGPQQQPLPPPQVVPPATTNKSLQGILAQMQQGEAARMQDSQMRRQQRRNLLGSY